MSHTANLYKPDTSSLIIHPKSLLFESLFMFYSIVNPTTCFSVKPYWTALQSINSPSCRSSLGYTVSFKCSTNARPAANNYEFQRNGKLLYNGNRNIYNIRNLTVFDNGIYKCVPSNTLGQGEEASVYYTAIGEITTSNYV